MTNEELFYVIELTKDIVGHEYESLFQVCSSEEKAKEIADRLNVQTPSDDDCYHFVVSSKDW